VRLREALIDIDDIENLGDAPAKPRLGRAGTDAAFLVLNQPGEPAAHVERGATQRRGGGGEPLCPQAADSPQNWTERRATGNSRGLAVLRGKRRLLHAGAACSRAPAGSRVVIVRDARLRQPVLHLGAEPAVELLRSGRPRPEPRLRADVEFTAYGWSRRVLYTSSQTAPPLPDAVFRQAHRARTPFWTTVDRGGTPVDAYVLNDRGAIYVLGTARQTAFGHLVTLGELVSLGFALFVVLAGGTAAFNAIRCRRPRPAVRCSMRCARASIASCSGVCGRRRRARLA
jgi:hypothetical protein